MDEEDVGTEDLLPPGVVDNSDGEAFSHPMLRNSSPAEDGNSCPMTDSRFGEESPPPGEEDVCPPGTNPIRKQRVNREQAASSASNPFSSPSKPGSSKAGPPTVNYEDEDVDFTVDDSPWASDELQNSHPSPFSGNLQRGSRYYGSNPPRDMVGPHAEEYRRPRGGRGGRGRGRNFMNRHAFQAGYDAWNYDYDMYSYGYPENYDNGPEYSQEAMFSDFSGAQPTSLPECPTSYPVDNYNQLMMSNPTAPGSNPPPPPLPPPVCNPPPPSCNPPLPPCSNPPPPSSIPLPTVPFPICTPPLPPSSNLHQADKSSDDLKEESSAPEDLDSSL